MEATADQGSEFFLSPGSGDEWIDLTCKDGSVKSTEFVWVDRGDRVKMSFNALYVSSREPFGYAYAVGEVTQTGELKSQTGDDEVFGVFPPSAAQIVLLQHNGNTIRFDRADAADPAEMAGAVRERPRSGPPA
jgi:hypothetical protein